MYYKERDLFLQNRVYCKLWRLEYKHKKGAYYGMKEIEQKFSQMSPSFHYKESVVSKVREIESSPSPPNWGNGKWASEWTLGWFKNQVSSQTEKLMAGTKFSDYLGLNHYKKAKKIKNFIHFHFTYWPQSFGSKP